MLKTVMGIINLQENENSIQEITNNRPLAAVPFAGRYRLIDFTLSNMVNSKINNVGVLLPNKSRSIMDHLRSGKNWDLARKKEGLYYLPPVESSAGIRSGDIQCLYAHLDYITHSSQKYVLIAGTEVVCNMDYSKALQFHQNTNADITMVYNVRRDDSQVAGTVIETAENGVVVDMAVFPMTKSGSKVAMGVLLMEKKIFIDIISNVYARGGTNFIVDGIMKNLDHYNVFAYEHKGYAARVNSTASYYAASMELLNYENWQELFFNDGFLVHTKVKDEAPAKYKEDAVVTNSMVANGCVIEGKVENSILFRGVKVGKGVHIKNSIVMQKCQFEENALIENVICDKNVVITEGKWLKGAPNYPLIVEKGVVI